jgi:DNA-binding transcriptional regulator YiaG
MTVLELMESRKLRAGHVLAAAILPAVSAPGELSPVDRAMTRLMEFQPSGSSNAWRYWYGFTPLQSFDESAIPRMMCGSGGDSTLTTLIDVEKDDSESSSGSSAFPSHNEIIAAIRSSLSLQIKELAEILRVQRPTVYSWIKNEVEPSPTNRERLQHLYRIALKWKQLCNLPADSLIRSTGADGHSVLELLKADEVDQVAIMKRLDGLATQRRKMKREADEKRPTADALAQSLGLGPDDISDQQEFVDALTGRRSNPE